MEKNHAALADLMHLYKNLKEFMTFDIVGYTRLCFNPKFCEEVEIFSVPAERGYLHALLRT